MVGLEFNTQRHVSNSFLGWSPLVGAEVAVSSHYVFAGANRYYRAKLGPSELEKLAMVTRSTLSVSVRL